MKEIILKTLKVLAGSMIVAIAVIIIMIMAINGECERANKISHPLDPTPEILTETILTENIIVEGIEVKGIEVR